MKKILLLVLSGVLCLSIYAQNNEKNIYNVSGGLLADANLTAFRTHNHIDYNTMVGWGIGGWVNIPLANRFSLEPQLQYNSYQFKTSSLASGLLLYDGKIRYFSVPVLLKIDASKNFAFTVGPQFDFMTSIEDNRNVAEKSQFQGTSFALSGGLEVFPHSAVTFFGRYVFGLTNQDVRDGHAASGMEYKTANIQLGLKFRLFGKPTPAHEATTIIPPPPPIDTDGDGITDDKDNCPSVPGVAKYAGCPIPDSDKDGVNDELDKCPTVPGLARYDGCPIPDTDKDGINDEEDKCPTVPGILRYSGCPIPDTDKDGINDEEDKCPDIAGLASNNGCPVLPANLSKTLLAAEQNISFGTGVNKYKLTTRSYTSLDKLVAIMNENPGLKMRISAHTDNLGNADANMKLTEDRANAVKQYMVNKGIVDSRIHAEGFGSSQPIADNKTAAGRERNRRIELEMVY